MTRAYVCMKISEYPPWGYVGPIWDPPRQPRMGYPMNPVASSYGYHVGSPNAIHKGIFAGP